MEYRPLGRTGVRVSELCFGTMQFGSDADEETSARMYAAGRDAGINFFDTANNYSDGASERILGRLIKGHRDDLIIATKCYSPEGDDINARGASRRHVVRGSAAVTCHSVTRPAAPGRSPPPVRPHRSGRETGAGPARRLPRPPRSWIPRGDG